MVKTCKNCIKKTARDLCIARGIAHAVEVNDDWFCGQWAVNIRTVASECNNCHFCVDGGCRQNPPTRDGFPRITHTPFFCTAWTPREG